MAKSKKRGKIPLLDEEKAKSIVRDIGAGLPNRFVADKSGISLRTLYLWFEKGRQGRKATEACPHFLHRVQRARAKAVAASVKHIRKAGRGGQVVERTTLTTTAKDGTTTTRTVEKIAKGEWQASAWFLERRHPDEFAGNRREFKEMREQLTILLKAVTDGQIGKTPETSEAVHPDVGGEAKPDAV